MPSLCSILYEADALERHRPCTCTSATTSNFYLCTQKKMVAKWSQSRDLSLEIFWGGPAINRDICCCFTTVRKKNHIPSHPYNQVWWPILGICALHLTHVHTHSSEHTHTTWTHTRSSGQPFMLQRPGSSWGFGALLKGTSVVVLKVEIALYIHSLYLQFLLAWDSKSQPYDYESDSLTIRLRLPQRSLSI